MSYASTSSTQSRSAPIRMVRHLESKPWDFWHGDTLRIERLRFIGKESNALEEVEAGSPLERGSLYTEYEDLHRDEWAMVILPKLKAMPLRELQERSGLSRAALKAISAGRRPHPRNQHGLASTILNMEIDGARENCV